MHVKSKSGRSFILPSDEEEAAIAEGIAADEDTYELSDEELAELHPAKVPIALFLSREVVERFRALGPNWQDRLDEALKDWLKTHG